MLNQSHAIYLHHFIALSQECDTGPKNTQSDAAQEAISTTLGPIANGCSRPLAAGSRPNGSIVAPAFSPFRLRVSPVHACSRRRCSAHAILSWSGLVLSNLQYLSRSCYQKLTVSSENELIIAVSDIQWSSLVEPSTMRFFKLSGRRRHIAGSQCRRKVASASGMRLNRGSCLGFLRVVKRT
jgi:hypothetical protein